MLERYRWIALVFAYGSITGCMLERYRWIALVFAYGSITPALEALRGPVHLVFIDAVSSRAG